MTPPASNSDQPPNKKARRAFEDLVGEHQSRIRRFIRSIGVRSCSVDDIFQEAMIVAYQRFEDFEAGASFPAWVCGIAHNLVRNDRRKEARRFNILNGKFTEHMESEAMPEELDNSDEDHHQRMALNECMELVTEENRELLLARYKQGVEATTIAVNMGLTPESVRMRLFRLRNALRNCISDKVAKWRSGEAGPEKM